MKYYILALISAFGLSSCSLVGESDSDCPDVIPEKTETIALSFKMISANIGSRADGSHDEIDSEWPSFEDLIDIRNFAFYIFLDNTTDKPLVMKVTDIAHSTNPNQMITGAFGAYNVTTVIPKQNLEALLGRELDIISSNPINFRIVLLANAPGGTDYNSLAPADPITAGNNPPTTYAEFMENANNLAFNLNDMYNPVENDGGITGIYKGTIPMFGMSTFTTTEEQLYLSRPEERIYLGDIYMLRCLAKIRVIDNAPRTDGVYPYVKAVTVSGNTNMAWQLPADVSNEINNPPYVNGQQVHTARSHTRSEETANTTYRLGYLTEDKKNIRFGYLPEQAIAYGNPTIHITAQLDANREKTYDIPMTGSAEYNLVAGSFGANILRNHIYTLSVNNIAVGSPAEITLSVANWTLEPITLNYTETVTVNPRMDWDDDTMDGDVTANSEVYVKPFTADGKPVVLQGSFTILNPQGALWSAYLIPNGGVTDAFVFTDETGETSVSSVSGEVDRKSTTLYIKPTNAEAIGEANKAILQVVVQVNGKTIVVPLVDDKAKDLNFTIVQMNKQ